MDTDIKPDRTAVPPEMVKNHQAPYRRAVEAVKRNTITTEEYYKMVKEYEHTTDE